MRVSQPAGFGKKLVRQPVHAAFTHHRLEQDRARIVRNRRTQRGNVVAVEKPDARQPGPEVDRVLVLPGDRKRAERAAVVRPTQRDQRMLGRSSAQTLGNLPPVGARELQRAFHSFRAAGRKENPGHAGQRRQFFCQKARPRV